MLEEVLRMVLEIVNSCLTHSLHHNPHLVYTLLYQRGLFAPFRTHPTFQDIIQNIDTVSLSVFVCVCVPVCLSLCLHRAVPAWPLRPLQDPSHLPGHHTGYRHCESLCLCLCMRTCLSLHLSVFTHTCAGTDSSFHSGPTIPSRTLYRR